MRGDLYAEVSARIIAELEQGAAPWVRPWFVTPGQNVPQNAVTNRPYSGCNVILLWLARNRGWTTPRFLTLRQAQEAGGNVRRGEHGTKVYFVKQLQVGDGDGEETETRLIPMLREYTVFNVDQCEGLPDSVRAGKPMRLRNPDIREASGIGQFGAVQIVAPSFGVELIPVDVRDAGEIERAVAAFAPRSNGGLIRACR
jgi:antirestriction protein ArdC